MRVAVTDSKWGGGLGRKAGVIQSVFVCFLCVKMRELTDAVGNRQIEGTTGFGTKKMSGGIGYCNGALVEKNENMTVAMWANVASYST